MVRSLIVRLGVVLVAGFLFAACFGGSINKLNPNVDAVLEMDHEVSNYSCSRPQRPFYIEGIADARKKRDKVGVKVTFLTETASVYLSHKNEDPETVTTWIREAMEKELLNSGLPVTDNVFAPGTLRVSIRLLSFFVEPVHKLFVVDVHALVALEIVVTHPSGRRVARIFSGYRNTSSLTYSDNTLHKTLKGATTAAMEAAVTGLCDLLQEVGS